MDQTLKKMTSKQKKIDELKPLLVLVAVLAASFLVYTLISGNIKSIANNSGSYVASGLVIDLDTEGFDEAIAEGLVLVDFWATWCAPCRIQNPILEELAKEISDVATITKVDVDDNRPVAARFGVLSIPTLILFSDGEEVERYIGVQQKETLRVAIERYL